MIPFSLIDDKRWEIDASNTMRKGGREKREEGEKGKGEMGKGGRKGEDGKGKRRGEKEGKM